MPPRSGVDRSDPLIPYTLPARSPRGGAWGRPQGRRPPPRVHAGRDPSRSGRRSPTPSGSSARPPTPAQRQHLVHRPRTRTLILSS